MHQTDQSGIGDSLSAVVELVGYELRELDLRREEVTRRIRNLYAAIAALKKCSRLPDEEAFNDSSRLVEPHLARRRAFARIQHSKQAWDRQNLSLRRACRIALLETEEAIPAKEIRARIVRRGSFVFMDLNCAVTSILAELNRMAEDGEVCYSGADRHRRWQRVSRTDESPAEESGGPQESLDSISRAGQNDNIVHSRRS